MESRTYNDTLRSYTANYLISVPLILAYDILILIFPSAKSGGNDWWQQLVQAGGIWMITVFQIMLVAVGFILLLRKRRAGISVPAKHYYFMATEAALLAVILPVVIYLLGARVVSLAGLFFPVVTLSTCARGAPCFSSYCFGIDCLPKSFYEEF